jgi:molecular chaperone GrpE
MSDDISIDVNERAEGPADAPDPVAELQEKLARSEQQRQDMLRTLAEYDNARKRAVRDLDTERKFAQTKLAADLLPVLDNLDRALDAARQAGETSSLVQGIQATQSSLLDALKRNGVTPIVAAPGEPFDPNVHQAVSMQPSADYPPNSILQVLQSGFMIHDRVLRPAIVIVAAPQ